MKKDVAIIGGANSAGQAAMYFSRFAKNVTMIVRGESISSSMSQYLIDQIKATPNIKIWHNTEISEAIGTTRLECLKIYHKDTQQEETIPASAMFIFIGATPHTDWLGSQLARDPNGFILSGTDIKTNGHLQSKFAEERAPYMLETSLPGVFVAGDVRHGSVKRVASAVGEGSMSVMFIHRYLSTV